jgi:hypothetical protein
MVRSQASYFGSLHKTQQTKLINGGPVCPLICPPFSTHFTASIAQSINWQGHGRIIGILSGGRRSLRVVQLVAESKNAWSSTSTAL